MIEIAPNPPAPPPGAGPETGVLDAVPGALSSFDGGTLLDAAAIAERLASLAEDAARYAEKASGDGTRRAYGSAWAAFAAWCQRHGVDPLAGDPGIVALYLTARANDGLSVSSLGVARAAIRARHRMAKVALDLDDPRVTLVMRGITNAKGKRPQRQAAPAVPALLRRMLEACPFPHSPAAAAAALATRHRAMLLIGFGAGLRRAELVALTVGDVAVVPARGLTVFIRRAKSDQQGEGRLIAIHANPKEPDFCPVVAFERWRAMRAAGPDWEPPAGDAAEPWRQGRPLFCGIGKAGTLKGKAMADLVVARLLKQAALQAGLDPARFSGHSLRRGLLTDAGDRQEPLRDVMRQSRHVKVETALGYMAESEIWQNNITAGVFAR
jgi:site-specific recombinase XerD